MTTNPGIWLASLMSLGLFSYLWKENWFFRFCEHAYLGLSLAHLSIMGWNNVKDMGLEKISEGEKTLFVLHGAGWGHGVGLCQIGAAVMGAKGYSYKEILEHYFPGAVLEKLY